MSDFSNVRAIKRTRKLHNCEWCNEHIDKGSSCVSWHGCYEGDMYTVWSHEECDAARGRDKDLGDELWYPGECQRGKTYAETQEIIDKEREAEDEKATFAEKT